MTSLLAISALLASVHSLNDLPQNWSGVAGDLVTRVPATLSIQKDAETSRTGDASGFQAIYSTTATFTVGSRTMQVQEIDLDSDTIDGTTGIQLTLFTDDALTPVLQAAIMFDDATQTYTLRDITRQGSGDATFVLTGQR